MRPSLVQVILSASVLTWSGTTYAEKSETMSAVTSSAASSIADSLSSDVSRLLQKMATMPHKLTYQGSFTYQHKDNPSLQSFRIIHWLADGVEHERLEHLNGPEREFLRAGNSPGCESLGNQLLQGRMSRFGANLVRLDELYKFEMRGSERVAGREASVVFALPLDEFRYSYFLSVDNETGILLKFWVVDQAMRTLERYQFIDLDLNPDIANLKQQPIAKLHRKAPAMSAADCNASILTKPSDWNLVWVPPGFVFAGQRHLGQEDRSSGQDVTNPKIDMLMYTDGLTSFSVFIELTQGATPEGVAQRGATLAAMNTLRIKDKTYRITVVGEIPVVTAQKIAQNIKPASTIQSK